MKTFVIVGCGRLAGVVAEAVVKGLLPEYDLIGVYSRTAAKLERIAGQMRNAGRACAVCESVEKLLALKPDILVETASPAALREWAVPTLKNGTSIVTLSIGALADDAFYREVSAVAKENGTRIYIASGATGGFDVLRTAALMGGASARFFNEKGPDALKGTSVYTDSLQTEQKIRGNPSVPHESERNSCSFARIGRSRSDACYHTIYTRFQRRYAKGRNRKRAGAGRCRCVQRHSRNRRLVGREYAAQYRFTRRILRDWPIPFRSGGRMPDGCGRSRLAYSARAGVPVSVFRLRLLRCRRSKGYCPKSIG